jgi:ABC-type Fe3+ transport system substrate-binding protein
MAGQHRLRGTERMRLGRRRFVQLSVGAVGAAALARATGGRVAHAQLEVLYRLARAEGQLNLYGAGGTAPYQASAAQFQNAFPGLTVQITAGLSNELNSTIDAQIAAGNMDCDVAVLQTLQDFERWKRGNALLPYQPEGFDQIPAGFKDPDGTNVGIRISDVAYAYNPDRVPAASVPHSAPDFLDPSVAGLCITVYPHDDDVTLYRYDTIVQKYGWDYMDRYMVNRPQFLRGHTGVTREIMGDRAGVSFDATTSAVAAQRNGGKIVVVMPEEDGVPIWPQSAAIFRGAPHTNAAKLYLSWLLTRDEQAKLPPGNWPVRRDVAPAGGFRPILEYNVLNGYREFVVDQARIEELRRRFQEYIGPVRGEPVI